MNNLFAFDEWRLNRALTLLSPRVRETGMRDSERFGLNTDERTDSLDYWKYIQAC